MPHSAVSQPRVLLCSARVPLPGVNDSMSKDRQAHDSQYTFKAWYRQGKGFKKEEYSWSQYSSPDFAG